MNDAERQVVLAVATETLEIANCTAKWARLDAINAVTKAAGVTEQAARAVALAAFMAATAGLRKPEGE